MRRADSTSPSSFTASTFSSVWIGGAPHTTPYSAVTIRIGTLIRRMRSPAASRSAMLNQSALTAANSGLHRISGGSPPRSLRRYASQYGVQSSGRTVGLRPPELEVLLE